MKFLLIFFRITALILITFDGYPQAPDWIQTARIFLLDAYQPPFKPELEFDAEKVAQTMEDMHANVARVSTMGTYATIQGIRFSTHPDQHGRDLLAEMIKACKSRGIRVLPYISTGHKLAWSMVTKDFPEYAQVSKPGGGPTRDHMYVGEDHGTVCWNTPYRKAYYDYIEHVVRDYDVCGMYFDTWFPFYFFPGKKICYCDGCRNGFREFSGLELPYNEDDKDYTTSELRTIDKYHDWYYEELVKILYEVRRIIKSYKNIPLIYNINNPDKIANEDPRVIEAMDAFLYERGSSMLERAEGISLARAMGIGVFPYIGSYNNWPRVVYNGYDFQQQIFTTVMFGGAPIIAQPYPYIWHEEYRDYVRYPFSIIEENEKIFTDVENFPYVAVIYAIDNPPEHAKGSWWWKADTRTSTLGAFAGCLYRHVQVTSAMETLLDDPAQLKKYKVLYLADIPFISAQRIENIKNYVKNGGGLIVSYATSLYDSSGVIQDHFGLQDLIQVKPADKTIELTKEIDNYQCMVGGPNDLYLLSNKRSNQFSGEWLDKLIPLWFYIPVELLKEGEVIMDIVTGDGLRSFLPGVIVTSYGKGRVLYSSSSIESLFYETNIDITGDLIQQFVSIVSGVEAPFQLDAPSTLIANMTKKDDNHYVMHLCNWTGEKFEKNDRYTYYLAPIENIHLKLQIPKGKKISLLSTFPKAEIKQSIEGNTIDIDIPRMGAYQGINLQFTDIENSK